MSHHGEAEDPRRRFLVQALAAGFFSGGVMTDPIAQQILGSRPAKLPEGRSIYRVNGDVQVNGQLASLDTRIAPGARVQTGTNGELVFATGENAFIVRPNSNIVLEPLARDASLLGGVAMLAGQLLSVFGRKRDPLKMTTKSASIGIRGTGVYLEADPEQTYFCTCYGVADVESTTDPQSRDTVIAKHHDRPLYIVSGAPAGKNIRPAPFINHTDQELTLVETLVGRSPPFIFPKDDYTGPRRSY